MSPLALRFLLFALPFQAPAPPRLCAGIDSTSVLQRWDPGYAEARKFADFLTAHGLPPRCVTRSVLQGFLGEAKAAGFDNAVVLDPDGNVAEFATANLFFVAADGAVVTPAANGTFLAGITRARVIRLLADEGIAVAQRTVGPAELETAREIFNTGNYGKVMPCTRYGARELPAGPVATLARKRYMEFAGTCRV